MIDNRKGLAMNYLVIMILAVLALGGVFFFILRAEVTQRLYELPLEEEEVEETVELPNVCPFEVGRLKTVEERNPSFGRDFASTISFGRIRPKQFQYIFFPFYGAKGYERDDQSSFYINEGKLYYDTSTDDIVVGLVTTRAGRSTIKLYCNWQSLLHSTSADLDYFQNVHNTFTIRGFVDERGAVICRMTNLSKTATNEVFLECIGGVRNDLSYISAVAEPRFLLRENQNIVEPWPGPVDCKTRVIGFRTRHNDDGGGGNLGNFDFVLDMCNEKVIMFPPKTDLTWGAALYDYVTKYNFKTPQDVENNYDFENMDKAKAIYDILNSRFYGFYYNLSKFYKDGYGSLDVIYTREFGCSKSMSTEDLAECLWKASEFDESAPYQHYSCWLEDTNEWGKCILKGGSFCSETNETNCVKYYFGDKLIYRATSYPMSDSRYQKSLAGSVQISGTTDLWQYILR